MTVPTDPMPSALQSASDGLTAFSQLMQTPPLLTLKVYPFGVLMQRSTPQGCTEYLIDPQQMAMQLSATLRFETGLVTGDTIYMSQEGVQKIVVEYHPRQKTALFLENIENPLVVPMPAMLLFRRTTDDTRPEYRLYAVKERPTSLQAKLFHVPLPNIYDDGRVCWGTVQLLDKQQLSHTSLAEDWKILLGTRFGSHNGFNRSKSHPHNICEKYVAMEQARTQVYPNSDLLPAKRTLEDVVGGLRS